MTLPSPSLRIGPHVAPPLARIPPILTGFSSSVFQTVLRDEKRLAKLGIPDEADQEAFKAANAGLWGIAHASMLTSLASPDPRIRNGSVGALVQDANLAASLGMAGVCFHVGYQKGHDDREFALAEVARKLKEVFKKLKPGARVLLENGCEGSELGQTVEEVGTVARLSEGSPEQLGVVLDTCHLHVAGFDLSASDAPDRLAEQVHAAGLAPYLAALHLNDAREPCGSHRDRHAVPGEGTIGEGLLRLRAQPLFASLPAILETSLEGAERGIDFLKG
ncbi:MAG: TIM barrel protein [Armatimonadetes bacterium]|nr:TIM barrel protein [Armatimonadota bacterium]